MARPKKDRREPEDPAALRARMAALPKLSERMIAFAKPLLALLPDPPSIEQLRQLMAIVTVAWNLPLYEQRKMSDAAAHRATFDAALRRTPPEVAKILSAMLHSRLTTYGDDPRLGFAEVVDEGHGRAKIVATGAMNEGD